MTAQERSIAMRKYVAAAFSIAVAIGPAAALDLGVGVQAGGLGIGTSVGVGRTGASVGIGTSLGGLGGADAGASVGTSNGSLGATVGASGQLGGVGVDAGASVGTGNGSLGTSIGTNGRLGDATGGLSAGTKGGTSTVSGAAGAAPGATSGRSAAASRSKAGGAVATAASIAPAKGVRQSITLPKILWPSGRSDRSSAVPAIDEIPGTPRAVVRACREAVVSAAVPFGVVSVRARSAGSLRRLNQGAVSAPIQVRIHYARQGGAEIRQSKIRCQLDATGKVTGLT
jgi:hypothetical protein